MFPEMDALVLRHQWVRDQLVRADDPGNRRFPARPIVARTATSAGAAGVTSV